MGQRDDVNVVRLTRAVGKATAMERCLTGRAMDAAGAERAGLVSRVVPRSRPARPDM